MPSLVMGFADCPGGCGILTVLATHADTALDLMADPSPRQRSILGAFSYSRNETWLHTDATLLPVVRRARAAWNFLMPSYDGTTDHALVSYDMNRLQGVPSVRPHIVTLNATERVDPDQVLARMIYEHPIYSAASLDAQRHLSYLNDTRLAFAGAYHGWGFHEDGCRSGITARKLDLVGKRAGKSPNPAGGLPATRP